MGRAFFFAAAKLCRQMRRAIHVSCLSMGDTKLPEYPRIEDVAAAFNVSPRTIKRWLSRGIIPYHKLGKTIIMQRDEIEGVLNQARFIAREACPVVTRASADPMPHNRRAQTTYECTLTQPGRRRRIPWRKRYAGYRIVGMELPA